MLADLAFATPLLALVAIGVAAFWWVRRAGDDVEDILIEIDMDTIEDDEEYERSRSEWRRAYYG